jgi:hypothetical protein
MTEFARPRRRGLGHLRKGVWNPRNGQAQNRSTHGCALAFQLTSAR